MCDTVMYTVYIVRESDGWKDASYRIEITAGLERVSVPDKIYKKIFHHFEKREKGRWKRERDREI